MDSVLMQTITTIMNIAFLLAILIFIFIIIRSYRRIMKSNKVIEDKVDFILRSIKEKEIK